MKSNLLKKLILGNLLLFASINVSAQVCSRDTIKATTPTDKFIINTDGTVNDVSTGLMWMRCTVGQTHTKDNGCAGTGKNLTWQDALKDAMNKGKYLGYDNWRLPNIKELATIVERQCYNPSINLDVFPETPITSYYSNTPDFNAGNLARYIYFADGQEIAPPTENERNVRLVRNITN